MLVKKTARRNAYHHMRLFSTREIKRRACSPFPTIKFMASDCYAFEKNIKYESRKKDRVLKLS